ncbi:MAG: hydroxyacylglutathione hydrolase, partial [Rhodospirillaceae bacterium]|nr:hydroxyacylglutathione hydrolase [Rhodospirillaceae bacterium]
GGVDEIKSKTGARVIGAAGDAAVIPGIDQTVADGESVRLGHARIRVIGVPGHTTHHVAYLFEDGKALFPGDTLFSLGCGRLFGGTASEMWSSLKKLRDLPSDTMIYPAHEYTNANADFALTIEKSNKNLKARAKQVLAQRKKGLPSIPTTLKEEKLCNPFLRADIGSVQTAIGMKGHAAAEVFAEIRKRKDSF